MNNALENSVQLDGEIPLGWAGSTTEMDYLNFGDALSPVMVSLVSGRQVRRVPSHSTQPRLAAVGTIGHGFEGGDVWFWGTGASNWKNPTAAADKRLPYQVPLKSRFYVSATRGPVSERLLNGTQKGSGVYGDPVWLLPRFYKPRVEKRWEIGVILHLSELQNRTFTAEPLAHYLRYAIPPEWQGRVHLITTVTPIGIEAMKDKMDEILACKRIVSTSLHGMVIAESYGIPCLYFSPSGAAEGVQSIDLDPNGPTDLRIVDLYRGLGRSRLYGYMQARTAKTDWAALIAAIDKTWEPVELDGDKLIDAFPLDTNLLKSPKGGTIWDHPILKEMQFQHDVAQLRKLDKAQRDTHRDKKADAKAGPPPAPVKAAPQPVPQVRTSMIPGPAGNELLLRMNRDTLTVPLSWVATTREHPHANLGDALSAFVVSAMCGLPVRRAGFDQPSERLVAVGTIGHNQRNGILHFWGTGVDADRNPVDTLIRGYVRPVDTEFNVHALRGPQSAATFRAQGIKAPDIFGDPVWVLPRFWPMDDVEKRHELGIILHISELETADPESGPRANLRRYKIPEHLKDSVHLINTYCAPTPEAMREKVREIASCKRIVSTSLHGLVLAETYGIPCCWFATYGEGEGRMLDLNDKLSHIDHRMRDFYLGVGKERLSSYLLDRARETDWAELMAWVDSNWSPVSYDPRPLIEAFPVPRIVSADDQIWNVPHQAVAKINF